MSKRGLASLVILVLVAVLFWKVILFLLAVAFVLYMIFYLLFSESDCCDGR